MPPEVVECCESVEHRSPPARAVRAALHCLIAASFARLGHAFLAISDPVHACNAARADMGRAGSSRVFASADDTHRHRRTGQGAPDEHTTLRMRSLLNSVCPPV